MTTATSVGVPPGDARLTQPKNRRELHRYVKEHLNVDIPTDSFCEDHAAPMDYLAYCFFEDRRQPRSSTDCIVWANRAGGKTLLAAIATLLDAHFKPDCHARILGGSGECAGPHYGAGRNGLPLLQRLAGGGATKHSGAGDRQ